MSAPRCALARAVGVDPVAPFDVWEGWLDGTRVVARTRAFIPIWRRPWMSLAADTYGSSLLADVGIDNVFGDADERYPEVALREVVARAPDIVLLPSEPYAFAERHATELRESVVGVRTTFVDGRDLFWWGIRTPVAAVRLQRVA